MGESTMRYLAMIVLVTSLMVGCDRSEPKAPSRAPLKVEVGGSKGGVHVNDPASGTKVDIDASGVHVDTPDTKVDTRR